MSGGIASFARIKQVSVSAPEKKERKELDVVLMHGATEDGEGARVLRARSGRVEAGEVRPLREGRPLAAGGEVVRLEPRKDMPALFDVHVEHTIPASASEKADKDGTRSGPAQVATHAYRESWDRTFGPRKTLN
jgi:hypothetical protein